MIGLFKKATAYEGPFTARQHYAPGCFPYDLLPRAEARLTLLLRLKLWWRLRQMQNFSFHVAQPDTPEQFAKRWEGDCVNWTLTARDLIQDLVPVGAARYTYCTTSGIPNDWSTGHAVLMLHTDRGAYIIDNLDPRWRPWNDSGYLDWNCE